MLCQALRQSSVMTAMLAHHTATATISSTAITVPVSVTFSPGTYCKIVKTLDMLGWLPWGVSDCDIRRGVVFQQDQHEQKDILFTTRPSPVTHPQHMGFSGSVTPNLRISPVCQPASQQGKQSTERPSKHAGARQAKQQSAQ